jgi:hypothetical protein
MFSNFNKPKAPKTEKPANHGDKLKRLAATALAVSGMGMMKPDMAHAEGMPQLKAPMYDITVVSKQLLQSNPSEFKRITIGKDTATTSTLKSTFLYAPNGNLVFTVDKFTDEIKNINGVEAQKLHLQKHNGVAAMGEVNSFQTIDSTPETIVDHKNFNNLPSLFKDDLGNRDISNPKTISMKMGEASYLGGHASESDKKAWGEKKIFQNGVLSGDGVDTTINYFVSKDIPSSIKKITFTTLRVKSLDVIKNVELDGVTVQLIGKHDIANHPDKLEQILTHSRNTMIYNYGEPKFSVQTEKAGEDEGVTSDTAHDNIIGIFTKKYTEFAQSKGVVLPLTSAKLANDSAGLNPNHEYLSSSLFGEMFVGGKGVTAFNKTNTIKGEKAPTATSAATKLETKTEAKVVSKSADYNPGAAAIEPPSSSVEDYKIRARKMSAAELAKYPDALTAINAGNPNRLKKGQYISLIINKQNLKELEGVAYSYRLLSPAGHTPWKGLGGISKETGVVANFLWDTKSESGTTLEIQPFIVNVRTKATDLSIPPIRFNMDDSD